MLAASASLNRPCSSTNIAWNKAEESAHYIKGFCCAACAAGLLKKLEGEEAPEWAEEEEELQADDMDVSDLQRRRLATFGNIRR